MCFMLVAMWQEILLEFKVQIILELQMLTLPQDLLRILGNTRAAL